MTDKKLLQKFGEIVDKRMAEGLKPVNKRLDSIGEQLTEQSKRFDSVDKQLNGQSNRLNGIDKKLDEHDKRFNGLEKQLKTTNGRFRRVEKDVSYIAKNFDLEIVSNRRRIQKIENQLDISTPQQ